MTSALGDMCLSLDAIGKDISSAAQELAARASQLQSAAARAAAAARGQDDGARGAEIAAQALASAARACGNAALLLADAHQTAQSYVRNTWAGGGGILTKGDAPTANVPPDAADSLRSAAEALGLEVSGTKSGGVNLLPPSDLAGQMASEVEGVEGFADVVIHGNEYEVGSHSGPSILADEFGAFLSQLPQVAGRPIRLLSCSTGRLNDGFAQRLANKIGRPVMAPSDVLHLVGRPGRVRMSIGPNSFTNSGEWRVFQPGVQA